MIIPDEFIRGSVEAYRYKFNTTSQSIYVVTIIAIIAVFVALPFIYVDISVQGTGFIRPVTERAELKSPVSAFVDTVYVREGQQVKKGMAILRMKSISTDARISYSGTEISDMNAQMTDLEYLAKGNRPRVFRSPVRLREYNFFTQEVSRFENLKEQAQKDYARYKTLFDKGLIAEAEYDRYNYDYRDKAANLTSFIKSKISEWQDDLNSMRTQEGGVRSDMAQSKEEKQNYTIVSPINGTIDQFTGIYKGSGIQAGQSVAVISPNSAIYVEVYVSPRDIGNLVVGMPIKCQVASFNYNEWGVISGKVFEISSDNLTDQQGNSFYKVKCSLEKKFLVLKKTNRKGYLKKGMPVITRFMVTRRSLFELLYQNLDELLNPTQYSK